MGWILFKRALRDLKAGWTRYTALALLIVFSIFIVVSLMGAAITVIDYTEIRDGELSREDGEFSVFVPLRPEELNKITCRGVSIEKMFYADYALNDEQILRVFKVRENINKISLIEGCLPSNDREAVIERRFAEVNDVKTGGKVKIGDREFTITGIGATPDYNTVYRKITDTVVDSSSFGLIFVTPEAYDDLYANGSPVASEEYYYAYLLNGVMSDEELKSILEDNHFDVDDVDDEYFREYWDRMTGRKDELLEGIDELKDGAEELADGAEELRDGIGEFHDGMEELHDAVPDLTDGIKALDDGAASLDKGVRAYTNGVSSAASGASSLADGASSLASGASSLSSGASQYASGVNEFAGTVSAMTQSEDPYVAGVASQLEEPASGLASGFAQIQSGASGVSSGAASLRDGASQLSGGLKTLNNNSSSLRSGASALHDGTSELRDGVSEFTDGIDELYDGSVEIKDGSSDLAEGARDLADGVKEFSDEANDLIDEVFNIETSNLLIFLDHDENPRIDSAADDVQINLSASIIFGVLLVMLFAYVISVFIVHMIDQESAVIGALYSMGVKRRTLILSYVGVPVIVSFIAGVAGTLIAVLTPIGIPAQLADTLGYFSMPDLEIEVTPFLLIYGLVIPPVTALIVNVLVIRKRLMKTPLALLRNEKKAVRGKELKIRGLKFINMFRIRQMIREKRAGLTVILGMFMSLLVALMALNTYVYCNKVKQYYVDQTKFEYMYNYKYPTEEVPEGGYEAVAEGLKKEIFGYTFDVTLMGITEDNPFFNTGDLPENDTDVVLSSAVANKYKLSVGDVFNLSDKNGDRLYAFRVAGIFDFSASLMVFMDIDRCRDLFGEDDEYFNVVFSDHELDIDSGRLYSVMSKKDIEKSAGIYVDMMGPMVITMSVASSVIFVVVMYLMVKMMIDRSSFNISLVKIFGFRGREVRKMYLDGNFYIVVAGALISIPLCKMIMDYIYPRYLVSNVGVGIDPTYTPEMYAAIFAVIIALYLVINLVLTRRIKKIVPAEVLKNRE
ncbi:putative ABC transport system permease protein [Ruminococcaceae bacterium YRB3002]|nr:putative ABC transport system permease protein [Ruminococcaceae bacterium YRB3002]